MGFSVPLLAIRATDQEGDSLEHRQGHRRVSPYGDRAAWRPSGASGAPFRVIGVGGPRSPPQSIDTAPKERGGFFVGRTCRHRGSTQRSISHKERLGLCLDFSVNAYGYKLGAMQAGPAAYGNLSGARGRLKLIALEQEGEDEVGRRLAGLGGCAHDCAIIFAQHLEPRTSPPYPGHGMSVGSRLREDWFPTIFRRDGALDAAQRTRDALAVSDLATDRPAAGWCLRD